MDRDDSEGPRSPSVRRRRRDRAPAPDTARAPDDGLLAPADSAVPGREGEGRTGTGAPVAVRASNPVLRVLGTVRLGLDKALALICIVTFVLLVVIVSWQVWTREVVDDPASWTEEAARYTFVVLALLGAAYVFSERGHIAVEILVERLPAVIQKVVAALVQLTIAFFAAYVLIYGGYRAAQGAWGQNVSTLPMSVGQVYMVLPVTGGLIVFYSVYHLAALLLGAEDAVPETDENLQGI